ncbi:arginine-hydroxylase NDUFAF5, mitochondrial-like [Macrosteles quadrilineatus]|uniref:arginine-hydroxylase NDUFAF5, mitochondrial-like n=1 Tax=Macrosteles quadrilineatus TaxID=74068 RepID=UPI0023E1B9F9|nr:arginine-hydroxylase NDUFAF5, mitochondrial-like [Macrosteles quadrilineatus]
MYTTGCKLFFCQHILSKYKAISKNRFMSTNLHSSMNIFDRNAKLKQKERAGRMENVDTYDYLKDEIGYRLADRVFDVKRTFKCALDLGCSRGYVSKNIIRDSVEKLIMCDTSETYLYQASPPEDGVEVERLVVDEEKLPFESDYFDLVISNLSLHWVNDLPGAFSQIMRVLKNDGVFLASVFGGDSLYELRCSLQLAELERVGGISPHISPFTAVQDIGSLLNRAGFTMLTIDTDEIVVGYPSMFELMWDLKGMGESNAARNRSLHLSREKMLAAAAIYQELYGEKDKVPATFQVLYMVGWKPDPTQPKPAARGSGEVSLKDLYRLDEVVKDIKKMPLDDGDKKK